MPIYEYKCNDCSNNFEMLVMGSKKPECPNCKSHDLSRLMSACGFISKSSNSGTQTTTRSSAGSACGSCTASS